MDSIQLRYDGYLLKMNGLLFGRFCWRCFVNDAIDLLKLVKLSS